MDWGTAVGNWYKETENYVLLRCTGRRDIMEQKKQRPSNCTLLTVKNFEWSLQAGLLSKLLPFNLCNLFIPYHVSSWANWLSFISFFRASVRLVWLVLLCQIHWYRRETKPKTYLKNINKDQSYLLIFFSYHYHKVSVVKTAKLPEYQLVISLKLTFLYS